MIRSHRRTNKDKVWAVAYLGLCVVMAVVGWMAVILLVPVAEAGGSPKPVAQASLTPASTPTAAPSAPGDSAPTLTSTADLLAPPSDVPNPNATPTRAPFQIDLYRPGTFVSQSNRDFCTAGAVQNMLNIMGPTVDLTAARQQQIADMLVSQTTRLDSYNGGFGPGGWALTMTKLGAGNYKLVIDATFDQAMRDAALAITATARPVGLLTWWGAHSWVMTGFRSDADPVLFPQTFKLKGAYIVDPFYPRLSDIWGQTLGPDTYRDMTAMAKNYIGWKRPEGHYPDRDGKWLLVIPVD
jgi:hypothetical protein